MPSDVRPLTANRLPVTNPFRSYAVVEVALGLVLALLVMIRAPGIISEASAARARWSAEVEDQRQANAAPARPRVATSIPPSSAPEVPARESEPTTASIQYDVPAGWTSTEKAGSVTLTWRTQKPEPHSVKIQVFPLRAGSRDFAKGFDSAVAKYPPPKGLKVATSAAAVSGRTADGVASREIRQTLRSTDASRAVRRLIAYDLRAQVQWIIVTIYDGPKHRLDAAAERSIQRFLNSVRFDGGASGVAAASAAPPVDAAGDTSPVPAAAVGTPRTVRSDEERAEQVLEAAIAAVGAGLAGIAAVVALIFAFRYIFHGMFLGLTWHVPSGAPGPLADFPRTLGQLFTHRTIDTYPLPVGWHALLANMVPSLRYLTPAQRELVGTFGRRVAGAVAAVLIVAALVWALAALGALPPTGVWGTWVAAIGAVAGFALIAHAAAAFAATRRVPHVDVAEEPALRMDNTGNPLDVYNDLTAGLLEIREGTFPNRVPVNVPPAVTRTRKGETDSFAGEVWVETQPMPVARGYPAEAGILMTAGAALRAAGFAVLLWPASWGGGSGAGTEWQWVLGGLVVALLVGWWSFRAGGRLLKWGLTLHGLFRFASDVFHVRIYGTYTASETGLGDGRGGTMYGSRVQIQSNMHARVIGSRVITESRGILEPRYLLDSIRTEAFDARLAHLVETIGRLQDRGAKLAMPELSPALGRVVEANLRITGAAAAAAAAGRQLPPGDFATRPPPLLPGGTLGAQTPPHASGADAAAPGPGKKQCPDCANHVLAEARKCMYCQFRFDAAPGDAQPSQTPGAADDAGGAA
jgi:hypothetical protein